MKILFFAGFRKLMVVLCVIALTLPAMAQTSRPETFRPTVRGTRAVVAGGQPLVVEAGLRMLYKGGNAVDAGVAATLAGSVIEFSHFAFGGEVPVIIRLAGKPVITINGQGIAPALATQEYFEKRAAEKQIERPIRHHQLPHEGDVALPFKHQRRHIAARGGELVAAAVHDHKRCPRERQPPERGPEQAGFAFWAVGWGGGHVD